MKCFVSIEMEKFTGNFKKIPLTSKVWGDPNFDEVRLIVLVDDPDGDTSGVWAGIYEGPDVPEENELDEDGNEDPFRTIIMQACYKLSECDPPKYEGGKKWIRQGSGKDGEEGMSGYHLAFGNIDEIYTPKANVDLDATMELWLQQIRETALGP